MAFSFSSDIKNRLTESMPGISSINEIKSDLGMRSLLLTFKK